MTNNTSDAFYSWQIQQRFLFFAFNFLKYKYISMVDFLHHTLSIFLYFIENFFLLVFTELKKIYNFLILNPTIEEYGMGQSFFYFMVQII